LLSSLLLPSLFAQQLVVGVGVDFAVDSEAQQLSSLFLLLPLPLVLAGSRKPEAGSR